MNRRTSRDINLTNARSEEKTADLWGSPEQKHLAAKAKCEKRNENKDLALLHTQTNVKAELKVSRKPAIVSNCRPTSASLQSSVISGYAYWLPARLVLHTTAKKKQHQTTNQSQTKQKNRNDTSETTGRQISATWRYLFRRERMKQK